jgi:hypothetical protein
MLQIPCAPQTTLRHADGSLQDRLADAVHACIVHQTTENNNAASADFQFQGRKLWHASPYPIWQGSPTGRKVHVPI